MTERDRPQRPEFWEDEIPTAGLAGVLEVEPGRGDALGLGYPAESSYHPTTAQRIQDQARWYHERGRRMIRVERLLRLLELALIALLAVAPLSQARLVQAVAGTLFLVVSMQLVYPQGDTARQYLRTAEALRHELFLYAAGAGHYDAQPSQREQILALRAGQVREDGWAYVSG